MNSTECPSITTTTAYQLIAPQLATIDRLSPWSTAELAITDSTYKALCEWFKSLDYNCWQEIEHETVGYIAGDDVTPAIQVTGLLFYTVFAECAKRHAKENSLWPSISRLPIESGLSEWFFNTNGQPTKYLKEVLSEAAQYWNLRHLFDDPSHHGWFCTIYLQFGFTNWAIDKRLPQWLSGQTPTVAIEHLLDYGNHRSDSFAKAWNALKNYRHNRITEKRCREMLESNPWIAESNIAKLLKTARSRLDLISEATYTEYDPDSQRLVTDFSIDWPLENQQPFFCADLCVIDCHQLTEAKYELRANGMDTIRILRKEDGEYYYSSGQRLRLPFGQSHYEIALIAIKADGAETIVATEAIDLWLVDQPANLFRKNGRRVELPDKIDLLNGGGFLIMPSAFQAKPTAIRNYTNEHNWALLDLPQCDYRQLKVEFNGTAVWWPDPPQVHRSADKPAVSCYLQTTNKAMAWNHYKDNYFDIIIDIPYGASVNWARLGTEIIDVDRVREDRYIAERVHIRAHHLYYATKVTLSISVAGCNHRIEVKLETKAELALMLNNDTINAFTANKTLSTHLASSSQFKCLRIAPAKISEDDYTRNDYLLEGAKVITKLSDRAINLPHLSGYGEELNVYRGYYNSERKLYTVADQVIDTGIIKAQKITADGIYIKTRHPIELSGDHKLYIWTSDKEILERELKLNPDPDSEFLWFAPRPLDDQLAEYPASILTTGLFYRGERIGSWNELHSWSKPLKYPMTDEQAIVTAEMLRWFKLPIASKNHRDNIVNFLHHNMAVVLPVWLSKNASPTIKLEPLRPSDVWVDLIGGLCFETGVADSINVETASKIIQEVAPNYDSDRMVETLPEALSNFGSLSPFLLNIIFQRLLSYEATQGNRSEAARAKELLLLFTTTTDAELENLYKILNVDEYFFRDALEKIPAAIGSLSESEIHNNRILLSNSIVRRIVAHKFIKSIEI